MLKFYNDRKQTFECKVKIEGAKSKEAQTRLVFEDGNTQRFYKGKTDVLGNCVIELPSLDEIKHKRGKVVLEVRINDVVFEPYRNDYKIQNAKVQVVEAKVSDKKKLLKNNVKTDDLKLINELFKSFGKLDIKHKKVLYEYVKFGYEPSEKVKVWANKIFNDIESDKARIAMYEVEKVLTKK